MIAVGDRLHHWLFDVALPFWSTHGIETASGRYVEHFSLDGAPFLGFRRVFVICRQIYVFSHAAELGWAEGDALARRGFEILVEQAWLGPDRGWARRLGADGLPSDTTPDLYVHAFALFALAWHYKRTRDPAVLDLAEAALDCLDATMRHPSGIGFWHEKPGDGPRLQNPHMHLLEAALALVAFGGGGRARRLADELVDLFATRFYDARTGTLAEYFDDRFARLPTDKGRWTEPGHQFEWAWILANYQRLTGVDSTSLVRGLYDFAEAHGVDPVDRRTYDIVRDDGAAIETGSRCWPNTERIKAAVAMYELFGADPRPAIRESGTLVLDRYLGRQPPGTWIDKFDKHGAIAVDKVPTSTLYHVVLAFAEVLRIAPRLAALDAAGGDGAPHGHVAAAAR